MIIVEENTINNLKEACNWLKNAWCDEPFNIWYEEFDKNNSEWYRECIFIEPIR